MTELRLRTYLQLQMLGHLADELSTVVATHLIRHISPG